MSEQAFIERYERPNTPVVIQGLTKEWKAKTDWAPKELLAAHGDHKFKVGLEMRERERERERKERQ